MRRSRALFLNLVFLTASSLALQGIAVTFQVYLAGRIGASGIGLFQLISSVYSLSVTVATSGVRFATTRLTAEEFGSGNFYGARKAVRCCLAYALAFSLVTAAALYSGAAWVSEVWIGDARCVLSLKILSFSLPFLAVSSVLSGFFVAIQQMVPAALVQIFEQLVRIGVTVAALTAPISQGLAYSCAAVVLGTLGGECFSCVMLAILYRVYCRRNAVAKEKTHRLPQRLLGIALPIAVSAYARTALSTLQQMLTPRGLRKSGASGETALATYGIIHGMVFPILMFPAATIGVLAQLIVPELTESQVSGRTKRVNYIVNRVFRLGLFFAMGVAGVLLCYAGELGEIIYGNPQAGSYLRIFAPLAVVMYLDTLVDGMLKGLGKQVASMGYNILDALAGVLLVYFLLPKYAIGGYVFAVFFTEVLNFALSLWKLLSITDLRLNLWAQARAFLCIVAAGMASDLILPRGIWGGSLGGLATRIGLTIGLYLAALCLVSCLKKEDWRWFLSLLRRGDE